MILLRFTRWRTLVRTACLLVSTLLAVPVRAQMLAATVAGTGQAGYAGDGGPGSQASLNFPESVAVDRDGNVYIADSMNDRIRRVAFDGTTTTIAGIGSPGYSGDGGPAIEARLNQPEGVALDAEGSLYIADYGNHAVRKVTADGKIITIAGGRGGSSPDGTPAVAAALRGVVAVALDSTGALYLADTEDFRVRRVGPDGLLTTAAGNGIEGFFGDGGLASVAMLDRPTGITVDAAGNLYIADSWNNRIRKVTSQRIITTVAGSGDPTALTGGFDGDGGPATQALLNNPTDVAVDTGGNLYLADTFNGRIRRVTPEGQISTVAGDGNASLSDPRGLSTTVSLNGPNGLAIDAAGTVYVADNENHRVVRLIGTAMPGLIAGKFFANPTPGDVNGDGRVNVQDAIMILRYTVGLADLTPIQLAAADVDGNHRVDVRDAIAVLRKSAGFSNQGRTFPPAQ